MEFFKRITSINFMGLRNYAAAFSIFVFFVSTIALVYKGLNLGLDFTGGTQIHLSFPRTIHSNEIRNILENGGIHDAVVQTYGGLNEILITVPESKNFNELSLDMDKNQSELSKNIMQLLPNAQLKEIEFIGPQVGKELTQKGLLAVIAGLIATMAYIAMRFEYRFALSAAIALIHDPVLILGLFAIFQWEFDLNVLAAVLAVIGYSLNDTIVVYDRIRENFRKLRKKEVIEVVNISINQTLSRTIMTSGITLLVVISLFIFGGKIIEGFAVALMIGIVIGTYSSIYVAGALAVKFGLNRENLLPKPPATFSQE